MSSMLSAGFSGSRGLSDLATVAPVNSTAPVSPALVWGAPTFADRELFSQDSNLVLAGLRPAVSLSLKYEEGEHGL
jgi:hypothetical protein